MPEAALLLCFIVVAAWIPGRLIVGLLGRGDLREAEFHFSALSLGLALIGWSALVLAALGRFSLWALGGVWLAATLAAGLGLQRRKRAQGRPTLRSDAKIEFVLLALWLPLASWLFLRPHEAILGGADAGVYVSTAAHIARQGAILVQDATLAQMDPALREVLLRPIPDATLTPAYLFPGFNVTDTTTGAILPDFFHYHPVWQAVAYALGQATDGAVLAVHAALMLPGLWALMGAVAVFLTLRQAFAGEQDSGHAHQLGLLVAALALGALSLNAIQVWFARYPVAETLSQGLLWSGLWAFGGWLAGRRPQRLLGLMAGVSFGLLLLTRIDMLFVAAVPAVALLWQLGRRRSRSLRLQDLWFYAPFGLLLLHATLHAVFISRPYFARIVGYGQLLLDRYGLAMGILILLAAVATWLVLRHAAYLRRTGVWKLLRASAIAVVVCLTAYAWFVRPVYGALPSYQEWYDGQTIVLTDRENLLRLAWYLSPAGVWMGVAGVCLLIWRVNRRTVTLLGLGLFFSVLYLWRIQANPHQIYVMRRYVPVVMPFLIAGGASLIFFVLQAAGDRPRRRALVIRAAGLLLALLWLGGMVWLARGFISQIDYQGLTVQLQALDEQLGPRAVLLVDDQSTISLGDALGTPLRFIYENDVYTLRDRQALDHGVLVKTIENWQNSGRSVYWIGEQAWLQEQGFDLRATSVTIDTTALEGSYDHRPYQVLPLTWRLTLNLIEPR